MFLNCLRPTEDYKASVLVGLSPADIMECAGKAMGFWTYQMAKEMFVTDPQHSFCRPLIRYFSMYQEYLSRNWTEKYGRLNGYLDQVIENANAQMTASNKRISGYMVH